MNKKGFSLAEIIVSLGIMMMFLSFSFWFYHNTTQTADLKNDFELLLSNIQRAHDMTTYNESQSIFDTGNTNYGVYINSDDPYYVLYRDLNNNQTFDVNETIERVELTGSHFLCVDNNSQICDYLFTKDAMIVNSEKTKFFNIILVNDNKVLMEKSVTLVNSEGNNYYQYGL